jgi:predicted metal-dependent RNase
LVPNADTTVLFAGYQVEGTRGRSLQDGAKEIKLLSETVPVSAKIKVFDGLSAHADQGEILRWLGTFKKAPRMTYIVHGEPPAANALDGSDPRSSEMAGRNRQASASRGAGLAQSFPVERCRTGGGEGIL